MRPRLVTRTIIYGRRDSLNATLGVLAAFVLGGVVGTPAAVKRGRVVVVFMGAGATRMSVRSDRTKDLRNMLPSLIDGHPGDDVVFGTREYRRAA